MQCHAALFKHAFLDIFIKNMFWISNLLAQTMEQKRFERLNL